MDISKYLSESLGIRDNESRLYLPIYAQRLIKGTFQNNEEPEQRPQSAASDFCEV